MMPGVIASESKTTLPVITPPMPTYAQNVVFMSRFFGTDGGTDAFDESPLGASMTFVAGAVLSSRQATFGLPTSLYCYTPDMYVSLGHNPIYDHVCDGDFTIECVAWIDTFTMTYPIQLAAVWGVELNSSNLNAWRIVLDSQRFYYQMQKGGNTFQVQNVHNLTINQWHHFAACRYGDIVRLFIDGVMIQINTLSGGSDITPNQPLTVGGNAMGGNNGYVQTMRIANGAFYRDDGPFIPPTGPFYEGMIFPRLLSIPDVIPGPSVGNIISALKPADETFFAPTITLPPSFVNASSVVTTAPFGGATISPPLVGTRANGNLLIAYVQCNNGSRALSVSGAGWQTITTAIDGNVSGMIAWRLVDGTETAPTFDMGGAQPGVITARMLQFTGNNASAPIGAVVAATGASTLFHLNAITSTAALSTSLFVGMVNTQQTIPVPAGYTAIGSVYLSSSASDRTAVQGLAASGSVSGVVNVSIASAVWEGYLIEIKR